VRGKSMRCGGDRLSWPSRRRVAQARRARRGGLAAAWPHRHRHTRTAGTGRHKHTITHARHELTRDAAKHLVGDQLRLIESWENDDDVRRRLIQRGQECGILVQAAASEHASVVEPRLPPQ
jgi:hypothetical protein